MTRTNNMSGNQAGTPPMAPEPDEPMPNEKGPVPPMRNPGSPPRPNTSDAPVPDPDDPVDNEHNDIERSPGAVAAPQ